MLSRNLWRWSATVIFPTVCSWFPLWGSEASHPMHWYVALLIGFQHYLKAHSDQVLWDPLSGARANLTFLIGFRELKFHSITCHTHGSRLPHLDKCPNADILWCQVTSVSESWYSVQEQLNNVVRLCRSPYLDFCQWDAIPRRQMSVVHSYTGRQPMCSVATGSKVSTHTADSQPTNDQQAQHKEFEKFL